ncbi:hypothetical protein ACFY2T_33270 [Streptomyces sp. NPDC001260]|uniref:hypothetical protein n=1 Tax=Streptomyces sp. NPDC001260 TaxID=3364551 RepID=UPI0036D12C0F
MSPKRIVRYITAGAQERRRKHRRATVRGMGQTMRIADAEVRKAARKVHARQSQIISLEDLPVDAVVWELTKDRRYLSEKDRLVLKQKTRKILVEMKDQKSRPWPRYPRPSAKKGRPTPTGADAIPNKKSTLNKKSTSGSPWRDAIGPVYSTEQARALLGTNERLLAARTEDRAILALRTSDGFSVYPAFQFKDGKILPGLSSVIRAFPDDDKLLWTVATWLRVPLTSLDKRNIIDALRDGDIEEAVHVARVTANRWSR